MKQIIKPIIIVLTLSVSLFLSIFSFVLPKTVRKDAPIDVFSSERAMKHVESIAKDIHPAGTDAHDEAAKYIMDELIKLGLKPEVQKTFSANKLGGNVLTGNVENIYAILPGYERGGKYILMTAHYDSTSGGPGAMDDASGVAVLLETIRALKAGSSLKNDVLFLFTDGEEDGLLGAKAFADENPLFKDIFMNINFEARGNSGPVIMFETGGQNGWFMKEFKKAVHYPVAYSFSYDVYKNMPNYTDFTVFKNEGIGGFNFAPVVGFETYHSKYDTPQNLNQGTLQHQGIYALSLVRHFGNISLDNKSSSNGVYFTLTRSVLVLYSDTLALPLSILSFILFAATYIIGYRKKMLSIKKTALGFLLSLISIVVSAAAGFGGVKLFERIYGSSNRNMSQEEIFNILRSSYIWMPCIAIVAIALVFIISKAISKSVDYYHQMYGSLILWSVLSILSGIMFKGASYMFLWPFILSSAAQLLIMLSKSQKQKNTGQLLLFIAASMSSILIFLPVLFLLFESMTITMAAAITGILALPVTIIIESMMLYINEQMN